MTMDVIGSFVYSSIDIENLQQISINAYISTITSVSRYSHLKLINSSGIVLYFSADLDFACGEDFNEKLPEYELSYIMNDHRTLALSFVKIWKVVIFDDPNVPVENLEIPLIIREIINARCLCVNNMHKCIRIPDDFLSNSNLRYSLINVDLRGLYTVDVVGARFMKHIEKLETLDVSTLGRVAFVGTEFLIGSPVKCLDLRGFGRRDVSMLEFDRFLCNRCGYRTKPFDDISQELIMSARTVIVRREFEASELFHLGFVSVEKLGLPTNGTTMYYNRTIIKQLDLEYLRERDLSVPGTINFLFRFYNLRTIDLGPLDGICFIGDNFLRSCSKLEMLDLTPLKNVREIGDSFLENCAHIKSLDLSPLCNVERIGKFFLVNVPEITQLDFRSMRKLRYIGDDAFLHMDQLHTIYMPHECNWNANHSFIDITFGTNSEWSKYKKRYALAEIDLTPLTGITIIKSGFLQRCFNLVGLDLEPLREVIEIEDEFLYDCIGILTLDLRPVSRVKKVGANFLGQNRIITLIASEGLILLQLKSLCHTGYIMLHPPGLDVYIFHRQLEVKNIDLSLFKNATKIDSEFIWKCPRLQHIDLAPLSNVLEIGREFLSGVGLLDISLEPLSATREIGAGFLSENRQLDQIDLRPLRSLTLLGHRWFEQCSSLQAINAREMSWISGIGNMFARNCRSLVQIDLYGCTGIREIGFSFLESCSSLQILDIRCLVNLRKIDQNFASRCNSLITINLSGLPVLESIGNEFAMECRNLETVDLSGLSQLISIGNSFLQGSAALTSVDLRGLASIRTIGSGFFRNTIGPKNRYLSNIIYDNPSMTDNPLSNILSSRTFVNRVIYRSTSSDEQSQPPYPTKH